MAGDWRRLHNEKLCDVYVSQVIKSGSVGWAGHVERIVEKRGACRVLVGKSEDRKSLEDVGVYGRVILKWIFNKWGGAWARWNWLTMRTVGLHL